MGKTTKVLFIWNEKGYSTLQSVRCRLILRYVFMTQIYGSHALYLISPNLWLSSTDLHTAQIDLSSIYMTLAKLSYCSNSDGILQIPNYSPPSDIIYATVCRYQPSNLNDNYD